MKRFYVVFTFLCCLVVQQTFAQTRYIDEVFTDAEIVVVEDLNYTTNMNFAPVIFPPNLEAAIPENLLMDVYMPDPAVDDVEKRPVIVIPSSTLNPRYVEACYGDRKDLLHRTIAPQLAKTGYVVILADSRRGWNPLVTTPNDFLTQLADGAIRQIQDMNSLSRFLQKHDLEDGNAIKIDSDKMIIWGITNGASTVATNVVHADQAADYQTPAYFTINNETGEAEGVFDEVVFGNIPGTEPGFLPNGSISNLPMNTGCYETNFKMLVTSGGVSLDTIHIDAGEVPSINFIAKNYVSTPFEFGPLNLPIGGDFCCLVNFGHTLVRISDDLGNNDIWKGVEFSNPIANTRENYLAKEGSGPVEGIYYLDEGDPGNSYPWLFYDAETCAAIDAGVAERTANDRIGATLETMNLQLSEMIQYTLPRACLVLDLGCGGITTGLQEPLVDDARIAVSPNPSTGEFTFATPEEHTMESISIYNISGSLMYQTEVFNNQFSTLNLDLANGMYVAKIKFEDGVASKKLVVGE